MGNPGHVLSATSDAKAGRDPPVADRIILLKGIPGDLHPDKWTMVGTTDFDVAQLATSLLHGRGYPAYVIKEEHEELSGVFTYMAYALDIKDSGLLASGPDCSSARKALEYHLHSHLGGDLKNGVLPPSPSAEVVRDELDAGSGEVIHTWEIILDAQRILDQMGELEE